MLNEYQNSEVGKVAVYESANGPVNVLEFYAFRGDIMGSLGACVGLLFFLTAVFAWLCAIGLAFVSF